MLGPRAADAAAGALLRLLLLLLLPGLRAPGLGVVAAAGAGLPESVIWAVNAGGEAHVDVHGIHFRKDPLEGRVGRGESPSAGPWDPGPASRGRRRRDTPSPALPPPSPFLSIVGPHPPRGEVSLCSPPTPPPRDLARAQGLAPARSRREPSRQRVGEKLYLDLSGPACPQPRVPPKLGKSRPRVALVARHPEAPQVVGHRSHRFAVAAAMPGRFSPQPLKSAALGAFSPKSRGLDS